MSKRIALGIEYDGSQFHGWQRQAERPSIQSELEKALSQVAAQPITTVCAGRTDAGVHATGQVVHFDTTVFRPTRSWVLGVNTLTSKALRVLWTMEVPSHFNARRSATSRRYRYVVYNHPVRPSLQRHYVSWHYHRLDIQKMIVAAQYWIGEHDFSSFRAKGCQSYSPVRSMSAIEIVRMGDHIVIEFAANAFLHHMVRNMVGVLLKIGSGFAEPSWAKAVLASKSRLAAGVTAPPNGLYLVNVDYPEYFGLPKHTWGPWFFCQHKESLSS